MKYGLTQLCSGCDTFDELTEGEFARVKQSRESLFTILAIEEKLEYVVENFREFESECLDIALDEITRWMSNWSRGVANVHRVSRRIVNLLATCRMYFDQVAQHVNDLFGEGSHEARLFKEARNREYDSRLSYRFIEVLRNYVQHCDLAIHGLKMHGKRVGDTADSSSVVHFVVPQVSLGSIDRKNFNKKSVLDELTKEFGELVDLRKPIREYMDALGRIHLTVREVCQPHMEKWKSAMELAVSRNTGNQTVNLSKQSG